CLKKSALSWRNLPHATLASGSCFRSSIAILSVSLSWALKSVLEHSGYGNLFLFLGSINFWYGQRDVANALKRFLIVSL
ncbi:hypothetical protein ALC53_06652, partial [Atta colombica]